VGEAAEWDVCEAQVWSLLETVSFINHDLATFAATSGSRLLMSTIPPSTPRRGTQRASHLRQVSNGSSETMYHSHPVTAAASDAGTVQHDPVDFKPIIERRCNVWVHDESFSKDEVVLNLDLFPDVKSGELMAIVALKTDSGIRDFQDKSQTSKVGGETTAPVPQSDRGHLNPKSPVLVNGSEGNHDVDHGRRYLFIAKDMPKEMKTKHSSLEISAVKHVADVFGLKHRSNVLVTTVSNLPLTIKAIFTDVDCHRPTAPIVPLPMSNCPSKTNTLRDLICGDWQLESSAIKQSSKGRRSFLWVP
jgi:hypothetical protein